MNLTRWLLALTMTSNCSLVATLSAHAASPAQIQAASGQYGSTAPATQSAPVATANINQRVVSDKIAPLLSQGYALIGQGNYDKAIEVLQKALKLDKDSITARRYLAYALVRKGQAKQAIGEMQKVSKQTTPNSFDWYIFGDAYYEAGGLNHAGSCFKEALHQAPAYDAARGGLIKTLVRQDQYNEAVAQVQQGLKNARDAKSKQYYAALYDGVNQAQLIHQGHGDTSAQSPEVSSRAYLDEGKDDKASKPVMIVPTGN